MAVALVIQAHNVHHNPTPNRNRLRNNGGGENMDGKQRLGSKFYQFTN